MDQQRVLRILGKDALERAENPLNWPQNREMSHHGDEVWRLKPKISRDTKPPGDNLCDMCRTIDFEYLFENKLVDNKDEVPLGYLDDIMAKDQCAFCRLVVWSIRQFTPLDPLPTEINGERIKVDIRNIQLGGAQLPRWVRHLWVVVIPELPAKFCVYNSPAAVNDKCVIRPPDSPVPWSMFMIPSSIHMIRIHSFGEPSPPSPEEAYGRGRKINNYIDVSLFKMWLKICENFHPKDYLELDISSKMDGLEVIDVYNKCIVVAPLNRRYVALSYMWGVNPFYTALNENWTSLQEAGAIDVNDERFPLTIRDAMRVTKGLGEQYLWVDSLCIIQDNPDHQRRLISATNRVYGGAIVTIVAAAGTDAHYGLPGVSRPRDQLQQVEHVQGLQLANALPLTFKVIDASTWNTRAWTYQERLLSQRLLVFTDQQCHFNCMYGNYCEELILEDYDDQGVVFKKTDWWVSLNNEPESHRLQSGSSNFGAYTLAVENFTIRNITYDEDSLNAFAGIMSSLERVFRGPFVYGLPATMFTSTLLWMPNRSLTRRRDKNGRPLFPSWCWASWIGQVHYHIIGLLGRVASPRVLWKDFKTGTWFSDEESNPASLWKTNPDWDNGGTGVGYFIDKREKSSLSFAIPVEHDSRASRVQRTELNSGILHFWSHIATFTVIPARSQKGLKDSCCKQVHHYTIHSGKGNDVGILFFDTGPPHPLDMMLQTTLALLSRQVKIINDRELHGDLICADLTTPFDLRQFKADRAELDGMPVQEATEQSTDAALTSMYHVMAIEQIGDIYERVGIGVVHMEAFHESKPVRTLIRLG